MGTIHLLEPLRRLEAPWRCGSPPTMRPGTKSGSTATAKTNPSAAMTPTAAARRRRNWRSLLARQLLRQPTAPDPPPSRCPRRQRDRLRRLGGRPDRARCDAGSWARRADRHSQPGRHPARAARAGAAQRLPVPGGAPLRRREPGRCLQFRPELEANDSVLELVEEALRHWPGTGSTRSMQRPPMRPACSTCLADLVNLAATRTR